MIDFDNKIDLYCKLLFEYNKKVRLTGSLTLDSIRELVLDSLKPFDTLTIPDNFECLDFGTGGGIPGIVLAVKFPNVKFVLLDSISKKIDAVNFFVKNLNLTNIKTVKSRIEEYEKNNFDCILSKAVAKLNVLIELTADKIKIGGKLFFYKGESYYEELRDSEKIQDIMGLRLIRDFNYNSNNHLLIFEKERKTTLGYPRKYKKIIKSPVK